MQANCILQTPRLQLRPLSLSDASDVQRLAGAREVAATTMNVPHPYENGMAESFIESTLQEWETGVSYTFAVTQRMNEELIGCVGLTVNARWQHAELGYWVGVPYWGKGYATEAASAILKFGFETLRLHRIFASYLVGNPASGRVMEKNGMQFEGTFREHFSKDGVWHDVAYRAILESDWRVNNQSG